jgi:hypothetical protein
MVARGVTKTRTMAGKKVRNSPAAHQKAQSTKYVGNRSNRSFRMIHSPSARPSSQGIMLRYLRERYSPHVDTGLQPGDCPRPGSDSNICNVDTRLQPGVYPRPSQRRSFESYSTGVCNCRHKCINGLQLGKGTMLR